MNSPSEKPINVGVIGLGFMGRTHVEAFSRADGCDVLVVADQDPARLTGESAEVGNLETGAAERLFDPAIVSTSEEALELIDHPEVELVSITTPTPTHLRLARAVMASGRHLLVEKPVALDSAAIRSLAAEARESGVLAMPAHCMRFWPAFTSRTCWNESFVMRRTMAFTNSAISNLLLPSASMRSTSS